MIHEAMRCENINLRLNNEKILNYVNFNVRRGEILGITGKRYAGKSSLIQVISGEIEPDSGRIYLNDRLQKKWDESRAIAGGIINVSQLKNIYLNLTPIENMWLSMNTIHRKGGFMSQGHHSQCAQILDDLHIDIDVTESLEYMSYFERLEVAFAAACAARGKIILLDEVIGRINNQQLQQLQYMISYASEQGISVLLADGDFDVLERIADRIYIMRDGMAVASFEKNEYNRGRIRAHIHGNETEQDFPRPRPVAGDAIFQLYKIHNHRWKELFSVRRDSITGLVIPFSIDIGELVHNALKMVNTDLKVCIEGKPVKRGELQREIGIMYDNDMFFPNLSLFDNLTLFPEREVSVMKLFINRFNLYAYSNRIIRRCFQKEFDQIYKNIDGKLDFHEYKAITMVRILTKKPTLMVYINPEHRISGLQQDGLLPRIAEAADFVKGSLIMANNIETLKYYCDPIYIMLDPNTFVKYKSEQTTRYL